MKIVLARQSTTDPVEIMKHLSQKCPNITVTTNPKNSDYMLYAGGWPGGSYRFMVIAKGGDTIYATETTLLSNAVKDTCRAFEHPPVVVRASLFFFCCSFGSSTTARGRASSWDPRLFLARRAKLAVRAQQGSQLLFGTILARVTQYHTERRGTSP